MDLDELLGEVFKIVFVCLFWGTIFGGSGYAIYRSPDIAVWLKEAAKYKLGIGYPSNFVTQHYTYQRYYWDQGIKLKTPVYLDKREWFLLFKKQFDTYYWEEWKRLVIVFFVLLAIVIFTILFFSLKAYYQYRKKSHLYDFKRAHVTSINFLRDRVEKKLLFIKENNLIKYDQSIYEDLIVYLKKLSEEFNYETFNFKGLIALNNEFNTFQKFAVKNLDCEFFVEMDNMKIFFSSFAVSLEKRIKQNEKRNK